MFQIIEKGILVRRQTFFVIGLLLGALTTFGMVSAQDGLTETYSDGEITFRYPADGEVEISENDLIYIDTPDYTVSMLGPGIVGNFESGSDDRATLLIDNFLDIIEAEGGKSSTVELDGRVLMRQDYEDENFTGFVLVFTLEDDSLVLVDAFSAVVSVDEYADTVLEIALSVEFDSDGVKTDGELPATLKDYDGDWQDAISELEDLGAIPTGGSLVFLENRAFFSGRGDWFTGLARRASNTDIVMAGELTFNVGDANEFETCSLLSRIVTDNEGQAIRFLDVGIVNEGSIFYLDRYGAGSDDYEGSQIDVDDFDFTSPHHFLIIALDDTLTVYLDGERLINQAPIAERAGSYGVALRGRGPNALCEGRNMWVYEAPSVEAGVCEVTASSSVNKRTGPGTSYALAGSLSAATTAEVIGQSTDTSGFTWWQLADENWVRDDVVSAQGDCRDIPVTTP